ncbi:PAS domain S-box protein [Flavobacterium sp. SM2513]|uniref:sensor histidine kinase n=1 Tax=Flavobacterium sp. SM2513 TaxID=3424766 RepID=UPI003D7FA729
MIETTYSIFERNASNPEALFFIENKATEGFWIWDFSCENLYLNHLFLKNLDYSVNEQSEITLFKLLGISNPEKLIEQLSDVENHFTLNYTKKDLISLSCEVAFLAIKDFQHKVTGYIFSNTKIIKNELSKKSEEASDNQIFIQREIFSQLEKIAEIGGWEINLLNEEVTWTNEVYSIHEVATDYVPRADAGLDFYFPEDRAKIVTALQETIQKHLPFDLNCRIITAKKNIKWVRCSGRIFLKEGKPFKIIGVFQDITRQIEQSEKLRISESTFRGNFEYAAIGMAILNEQGAWLEVNKRLCEIIGYNEDELKKITFQDITHPEDLDCDLELLNELSTGLRESYQMDKRYFHKNGSVINVRLSVSVVRKNDGTPYHYISQIIDITANILTKNKLEDAIRKQQAVFNASTHVSIIATDKMGLIKNFNSGAENLLGYKASEMIGIQNITSIHSANEIKSRKAELEITGSENDFAIFSSLSHNSFETREWAYVHKEGYHLPVLLTITEIEQDNLLVGYLGIAIDLTEIKKAEKEITSLLEITNDQNDRLRNFAHIVSHNLRSHASNFKMLLDLLVHDHPEFKENEFINYLETASDDLKETITHLNEVVQLNTTLIENLETINLHEVVELNIRNLLALANKKNVVINNNITEETTVQGITAYISSIINNLLTNAIKYSKEEGEKYVTLSCTTVDNLVQLVIEDNGIGIDLKRNGNKIFGMYKTFHNNKDARGIGLFITKNQVEAMSGKIEVESKLKKGTTFKIQLKK